MANTLIKPRWRVLVVDDHAPSRAALAQAVAQQGGQVVGNGSRAEDLVHLVERHRPDVAVFAVGLPDGDGLDGARTVMSSSPCALVVLTSRTEADVAARAAAAGVLGFLAKPLRQEELGPALDLAVSRFRDLDAVRRENLHLKKTLEARKLVDRAKALLIERLGLSEADAYRRLQKTAMDTRRTMGDVAQALLSSQELSQLGSARQ